MTPPVKKLEPRTLTALWQAIEYIAFDNGAINRQNPKALVMTNAWLALLKRYTYAEIIEIEDDLLTLSPALLEEVCAGEMPEPMPIKTSTNDALNFVFDNLP